MELAMVLPWWLQSRQTHFLKCHGSHGIPDVQTALQHSCNSYFCKIYNDFIMDSTYNSPEIGYKKWWNYMYNLGIWKKNWYRFVW
jgi:cell division protein FtsI/penicillin-binding protein 2